MKRLSTAFGLAIALTLAGCGADAEPEAVEEPTVTASHAPTDSPTTATPTPTASAAANDECGVLSLAPKTQLLRSGWDLVVSSREAGDHQNLIEDFSEQLEDLYDDVDDLATQEEKNACGAALLSQMAYEVALMSAQALIDGEADDEVYQSGADAANEWLDHVGLANEVEVFTPTYQG